MQSGWLDNPSRQNYWEPVDFGGKSRGAALQSGKCVTLDLQNHLHYTSRLLDTMTACNVLNVYYVEHANYNSVTSIGRSEYYRGI